MRRYRDAKYNQRWTDARIPGGSLAREQILPSPSPSTLRGLGTGGSGTIGWLTENIDTPVYLAYLALISTEMLFYAHARVGGISSAEL